MVYLLKELMAVLVRDRPEVKVPETVLAAPDWRSWGRCLKGVCDTRKRPRACLPSLRAADSLKTCCPYRVKVCREVALKVRS
jgi:hypothetical protein